MINNTLDLYCDSVLAKPIDTCWSDSEAFSEEPRFRVISPDFFEMETAELFEYADDYGVGLEDDPRKLSRAELIEGLESIGCACYDEESDELLANAYGDSMMAGDLGNVDRCEWPDCVRNSFEEGNVPMMSYRYPVKLREISENDSSVALVNLPLCLVYDEEDEEYFLALTGGGMDLSAEICKAYIVLKQRPPVHFCGLPRMAGRKYSQDFITVCIESCEVAQNWAQNTIDDLLRIANDPECSEKVSA